MFEKQVDDSKGREKTEQEGQGFPFGLWVSEPVLKSGGSSQQTNSGKGK